MPSTLSAKHKELHLLSVSFLGLFLELALIRYINSTVQVIAYFNNFLILSAFLGLGFGSLLVRYDLRIYRAFPYVLLAVVALATRLDGFGFVGGPTDLVSWFLAASPEQASLPLMAVVPLVFVANFLFFVPLGERLGACLDLFEKRLVAYGYDLAGSLLGVLGFGLMSLLRTQPAVWFAAGGVLALALLLGPLPPGRRRLLHGIPAVIAIGLAAGYTLIPQRGLWSPYYKVTYQPYYA